MIDIKKDVLQVGEKGKAEEERSERERESREGVARGKPGAVLTM